MTELAKREPELVKRSFWEPTPEDLETLKNHLCSDLDEQEFKLFLYVCKARGLNPLLRQIYAVKYPGWGGNPGKVSHITSIEGFLLIAERTGEYEGYEDELVYDKKGNAIARCTVYRKGKRPTRVECDYWEFCQTTRGKNGADVPNRMWKRMPKWMLQKVALARALDRAFPEELGGLYTQDEMPSPGESHEERPREVEVEAARERQLGLPPATQGGGGLARGNLERVMAEAELKPEPRPEPEVLTTETKHRETPPQTSKSAQPETNKAPDEWKPELPEHGHPAYQAWLTELSKGSYARELIGNQKLPYLKNYLANHRDNISADEKHAVGLVIDEMGRQYAKHRDAGIKLKVEAQLDEGFGGMHEYVVGENQDLLEQLGKVEVIGGRFKGLEFRQLEQDYLEGHLEANRGNLDETYEKNLTQYLMLRKEQRRLEAQAYNEDNIPSNYGTNKGAEA